MAALALAAAVVSMFAGVANSLADTDTITWGGDNSRAGYQTNHNMDPSVVASDEFAQLFQTALPGDYIGAAEQIYSQPLVYTPSDGVQYVYFATTQNNVYKLNAKTGEIVASRNLHIPFLTADLDGCVDINPTVGVTSTGVIDPDTDTLYLTAKTYLNQDGGTAAQGRDNGRYYFHALDVNDLTERENFPVNLEGTLARNNPVRMFTGGIHHQRPALLHSGQYIYAGFASHCVQYNFTGWIMGWDKTTGAIVEHWATEGDGVPNTTPGGGVWMSGGGLASDDAGSMFFATGNGYASQLSDVPVAGRNPPTSLEEAAVHMTINDDGSLTIVDFFMPYEKQALDGADKDLGTSPLEILPSEFSCGDVSRIGVVTGKSGKTYWLNLDDLGGYRNGDDSGDDAITVYQNENSVYAGAGVYPLEGGYVYINVINYPSHVFKFSCDNGVPSFTKVADNPTSNAAILGVGHGTVTSLNGQEGTGLVWVSDVRDPGLRIYNAVPEDGLMTLVKSFSVSGITKFTRPVFGDGIVYLGTTQGYVYGFGAPTTSPVNCSSPISFGTADIGAAATTKTVTCTAKIGVTVSSISLNSTDFAISGLPTTPLTVAAGASFTFQASFEPTEVGLVTASVMVATTNSESGYSTNSPVSLTGTGQSENPLFSISPSTLTFDEIVTGDNPSGVTQSVIFSNEGNSLLTVSGIQYSESSATGPFVTANATGNGTQVGPFSFSGLPSTIAANGGATVSVNFNPTASGNYSAYLVISTDGGDKTLSISASSGPAPVALLEFQTTDGTGWVTYENGKNFTFGNVTENTTRSLKLRLTNAGGDGAVALSVTVSKPPFGVSGIIGANNQVDLAEGTSLGPGESATATLYCSVPKEQWNTDPYWGSAQWTMNLNDPDWGKQYIQFSCEAVSEQAPPLRADGLGQYRYVGCFKENNPGRQLSTQLYGNDSNTNAMCIAACAAGGYKYCGTQYQRECWAGPDIPTLEVDEDDCNYACSGDINEVCGGNGVGDDAGGAFISLFADPDASGDDGSGGGDGDTGSGSAAVINPGVDGFVSLGCYTEATSGRALKNLVSTDNETVASCIEACSQYSYVGLEYGGECWCANTFGTGSTLTNATDCNMPCNDNSTELCGGSDRLNVYAKNGTLTDPSGPSVKQTVGDYQYVGCYTEATDGRALYSSSYADDAMTLESCAAFCDTYTYFGVEYSRECYCGNTLRASSNATDEGDCSMTCEGDDLEYCGGSSVLQFRLVFNGGLVLNVSIFLDERLFLELRDEPICVAFLFELGRVARLLELELELRFKLFSNFLDSVECLFFIDCLSELLSSVFIELCIHYKHNGYLFNIDFEHVVELVLGHHHIPRLILDQHLSILLFIFNQGNVNFTYYGCVSEPSSGRIVPQLVADDTEDMTIETCLSLCWMYNYAGVEYGSECWCGNALDFAGYTGATPGANVSDSECSFTCPGNSSEYCGAGLRLSMYWFDIDKAMANLQR
ncbi:WSC-domain-containing protein [Pleurostoma richardsiae]|uniref:WSC-domain-containing protein n=1 Tax=Pleurostoma richardsiae TaxID=41990 RepID=A0AA38RZT4_9PEZI|nr:WSC-domain-containing protein [Pleurostoma richardsiae]